MLLVLTSVLSQSVMHGITVCEILLLTTQAFPSFFTNTPLAGFALPVASNSAISRIRITDVFLIGSFLIYVATVVRLACYRELGRHFTFQLAILPDHQLIKSGPYSIVRHPSYTASLLVNTGVVMCQLGSGSFLGEVLMKEKGFGWGQVVCGIWAIAVTAVSYMLIKRIPREDLALRKEFGQEWNRWAQQTRYRLIPGVY